MLGEMAIWGSQLPSTRWFLVVWRLPASRKETERRRLPRCKLKHHTRVPQPKASSKIGAAKQCPCRTCRSSIFIPFIFFAFPIFVFKMLWWPKAARCSDHIQKQMYICLHIYKYLCVCMRLFVYFLFFYLFIYSIYLLISYLNLFIYLFIYYLFKYTYIVEEYAAGWIVNETGWSSNHPAAQIITNSGNFMVTSMAESESPSCASEEVWRQHLCLAGFQRLSQ